MYKIAERVSQSANYILLHAYSHTAAVSSWASTSKIFIKFI